MMAAAMGGTTPMQAQPGHPEQGVHPTEFLTFALDGETFAIEVERVHEVVDPPPVTAVPNAPAWVPGLANIRGNIVPLVNLRKKLAMAPRPAAADPRIVVAEVALEGETTLVGLEADAVYEVFDSTRLAIDDLPRLGSKWRPEFIRGVVKQDHGFVIILDIERILTGEVRHFARGVA